jgi:hypothetical protein
LCNIAILVVDIMVTKSPLFRQDIVFDHLFVAWAGTPDFGVAQAIEGQEVAVYCRLE